MCVHALSPIAGWNRAGRSQKAKKGGTTLKRMDGDEWGEPREVDDVMGKQVLQAVSQHCGRDIGVVHLPALDRKPLNQFAKLFRDESVRVHEQMANARYHHKCPRA